MPDQLVMARRLRAATTLTLSRAGDSVGHPAAKAQEIRLSLFWLLGRAINWMARISGP
jgi:hypothetical protein